jgi:hypothetical protein
LVICKLNVPGNAGRGVWKIVELFVLLSCYPPSIECDIFDGHSKISIDLFETKAPPIFVQVSSNQWRRYLGILKKLLTILETCAVFLPQEQEQLMCFIDKNSSFEMLDKTHASVSQSASSISSDAKNHAPKTLACLSFMVPVSITAE